MANAIGVPHHSNIKFPSFLMSNEISKLSKNMQDSVDYLIYQDNFIFILVDKLFNKDPVAFSMYKEFYKDNATMILEETEVLGDHDLYNQYISMGAGYDVLMQMNANHWLQSTDLLE